MHFRQQGVSDQGRVSEHIRSESELLEVILEATSYHYRNAVKYCLREDASQCQPHYGTTTTTNHMRFYRKVIEPLDNHYQELRKHAERHSKVYDAFGQHTARYASFPRVH